MKGEQVIYGLPPARRVLERAAGVVAFNRGVFEFNDGGFAQDLARRFPVSAPPGPVSTADAKRRLAAFKTVSATSSAPLSVADARRQITSAKHRR